MRERLEARCEELKSQASNRPISLATIRKNQLVEAAVTELLWSRDRAERETLGQLRPALRELRHEEEELQPERKKLLPLGWKRFRAEEIKEVSMERNIHISEPDGKPQVRCRSEHVQRTCRSTRRPDQHGVNSWRRRRKKISS